MRIVSSAISYAIPPVGTALPLWATFQWDLPVALALIFVSLTWAFSLVLLVAAISQEQDSSKDVSLALGMVEWIDRDSQDSIQVDLVVGTKKQRFTASDGTVANLGQDESVVFAYMRQSKKIIRIATIDSTLPGRISLRGAQR